MHVLASVATSIDGYVDDRAAARLILSSPEDLREVYRLRATMDAVMVGARTVRRDDPSLVTTHAADAAARAALGRAPDPLKVTRTRSGDLDPGRRFFMLGAGPKVVFAAPAVATSLAARVGDRAEVVASDAEPRAVLEELARRGVARLMIEGGPETLRDFLAADLVDELRVAVAPRLLGERGAARFDGAGGRLPRPTRRETFGDTTVTWYTFARGDA